MILFIKHIGIEGPGTLGDYFQAQGFQLETADLEKGDRLPDNWKDIDAVVSLGGPMNVYQEQEYPFLVQENEFIKKVLGYEIPFMGICLGSQLLAKACSAKVEKSPQKEMGFFNIDFTKEGQEDPLFSGLGKTIEIFQWHEDMSLLPEGAQLLASSAKCPHQAFRAGACAYGLQFHVEITDISIREWCDKYINARRENALMKESMLRDYQQKKTEFDQTAEAVYRNFLRIINGQKNNKKC